MPSTTILPGAPPAFDHDRHEAALRATWLAHAAEVHALIKLRNGEQGATRAAEQCLRRAIRRQELAVARAEVLAREAECQWDEAVLAAAGVGE